MKHNVADVGLQGSSCIAPIYFNGAFIGECPHDSCPLLTCMCSCFTLTHSLRNQKVGVGVGVEGCACACNVMLRAHGGIFNSF